LMDSALVWAAVALCAVVTAAERAIGPVTTGERTLPPAVTRVLALLAPALLTALVVTQVFADGGRLAVGADTVGVGVAVLLLWRRVHTLAVVLGAAATTALLRAVGVA
jgi:branched-subunit amino acid transport protein